MGRRSKDVEHSIYDVIKKYNKSASESTLKVYAFNIEKLFKDLDTEPINENHEVFENVDKVLKMLDNQNLSVNTLKNKISSIITYLLSNGTDRGIIQKYSKKVDDLTKKLNDTKDKMEWNDKEEHNLESISTLKEYVKSMKEKLPNTLNKYSDYLLYMKYLAGAFYLTYPLRSEMADMKIYYKSEYDKLKEDDNETNYLILNPKTKKGYVILNNFKTKKTYGTITFDINEPELIATFDKYYQSCKKNIKDYKNYILFKHDLEKFSRNDFTKFMNSVFSSTGKKISVNMIRKMVLSEEVYNVPKIKEMSHIMGHSIKTQISNYVKD
jgi:uncharacterized protein YheU (UPF0270 family)